MSGASTPEARATPSPSQKQRPQKKCQFVGGADCGPKLDKCATWLCRRGGQDLEQTSGSVVQEVMQATPVASAAAGACDDSQPPPKNCYRLVMLGSARVGKTSLVARFLGAKFEDSYTPTIEDFHRKLYRIRGEIYQLDLLDTSGNHPFPAMRRLSFLTGDLFVLVFSMDSRESFEEVIRLREQILETKMSAAANSGSRMNKRHVPRVPMAIAGNKCDREIRTVQPEEAAAYCSTQDSTCVFVETSAKKERASGRPFLRPFYRGEPTLGDGPKPSQES